MLEIVTVNHDTPKFIELCIKGVKLRTKTPYRHIIIDNGSKKQTMEMLNSFAKNNIIKLIRRNMPRNSSSHANSLDWYLHNHNPSRVCFLDSDAFPIVDDWTNIINNMVTADISGPSHFRDESIIHVSTMFFDYSVWKNSKKPSFKIMSGKNFMDTGMAFCYEAIKHGFSVKSINRDKFQSIVRHRWCGTRVQNLKRNQKLDGIYSQKEYYKVTQDWLSHPAVEETLKAFKL